MMTYPASYAALGPKPGKVTAIAIMALVDGILNLFYAVSIAGVVIFFGLTTCGIGCLLVPLALYPLVLGVLELVYATKLLPEPPQQTQPAVWLAILQICNIVTGNGISLVAGVVTLVLFSDSEVQEYFRRLNGEPAPGPRPSLPPPPPPAPPSEPPPPKAPTPPPASEPAEEAPSGADEPTDAGDSSETDTPADPGDSDDTDEPDEEPPPRPPKSKKS